MFGCCHFRIVPSCRVIIKCSSQRPPLTVRKNNCRLMCNDNGGEDSKVSGLPEGRYIPRRIRRRLEDKGLSIEDLEYKPLQKSTSSFLENVVEEPYVDKNVEIDFPSDAYKIQTPDFPSDAYKIQTPDERDRQGKFSYRPPGIDPADTSILLFPGQGSQFVGMGLKLLKYPGVEGLYNQASEILGYDLLKLCVNGPKESLDKTIHCQPAVVVTSLAAIERLKEEYPQAVENCVGMSGFSVGEYTALVHDGVISFEDAIQLIKLRAEAMQAASEIVPSGMLTVFCDHKTKLRTAMVAAREYCRQRLNMEEPVCRVANFLCTDVKVVAGHEEALEFLQKYGAEWGISRTKRLPVSGAFHTELMYHWKKTFKFWDFLDSVNYQLPKHRIHSNLDGKPYMFESEERMQLIIRRILRKQILKPVTWEQTMHILYSRKQDVSFPQTFEVGPGRQLGYLLQKTNLRAFESYKNIQC